MLPRVKKVWFERLNKLLECVPDLDLLLVDKYLSLSLDVCGILGLSSAVINASSSGANTIINGVEGKVIKVYAVKLIAAGDVDVKFQDGTTDLEGSQSIAGDGFGYVESVKPPAFLFACSAGNSLTLYLSGAIAVGGRVSYWLENL